QHLTTLQSLTTTILPDSLYSNDEITTASAVVTLASMTTDPRGAPISGAMMSPTSIDISHHLSPQARTPRDAQRSAYSSSASLVASGIAPRECETRYFVRFRMGKRLRKRRSESVALSSKLSALRGILLAPVLRADS